MWLCSYQASGRRLSRPARQTQLHITAWAWQLVPNHPASSQACRLCSFATVRVCTCRMLGGNFGCLFLVVDHFEAVHSQAAVHGSVCLTGVGAVLQQPIPACEESSLFKTGLTRTIPHRYQARPMTSFGPHRSFARATHADGPAIRASLQVLISHESSTCSSDWQGPSQSRCAGGGSLLVARTWH